MDSESYGPYYEEGSSYYGRGSNGGGGGDANDRRIAQIEKAFGSSGQVRNGLTLNGFSMRYGLLNYYNIDFAEIANAWAVPGGRGRVDEGVPQEAEAAAVLPLQRHPGVRQRDGGQQAALQQAEGPLPRGGQDAVS